MSSDLTAGGLRVLSSIASDTTAGENLMAKLNATQTALASYMAGSRGLSSGPLGSAGAPATPGRYDSGAGSTRTLRAAQPQVIVGSRLAPPFPGASPGQHRRSSLDSTPSRAVWVVADSPQSVAPSAEPAVAPAWATRLSAQLARIESRLPLEDDSRRGVSAEQLETAVAELWASLQARQDAALAALSARLEAASFREGGGTALAASVASMERAMTGPLLDRVEGVEAAVAQFPGQLQMVVKAVGQLERGREAQYSAIEADLAGQQRDTAALAAQVASLNDAFTEFMTSQAAHNKREAANLGGVASVVAEAALRLRLLSGELAGEGGTVISRRSSRSGTPINRLPSGAAALPPAAVSEPLRRRSRGESTDAEGSFSDAPPPGGLPPRHARASEPAEPPELRVEKL